MLFCGLSLIGCNLINPDETIPTRIHIEPFEFQIQSGQGSAQHKITEVWVYANGNFLGAFSPPVEVNYLEEGPAQFAFRPGIRNNGILDDAIVYPMVTGYNVDLTAQPGAEFEINPVTRYKPEAFFSLLADFESGNEFVDNRDTVGASILVQSTVDVFEGQFAGEMILSEEAYFIEVSHAVPMSNLPTDGTPTYLEFRYKNEVELNIGILGIQLNGESFSNFFYLIHRNEEWNMLYIELTDLLSASQLPAYKIIFQSFYPIDATQPEYKIYLDNIKVVHL